MTDKLTAKKYFHCKIPFGLNDRIVEVFSDSNEYLRIAKKTYNRPTLIPVSEDLLGQAFGLFVWLRDPCDVVTAVHEFIHVIDDTMKELQISNDTEVRAYLMNGLLRKYMKKAKITVQHKK